MAMTSAIAHRGIRRARGAKSGSTRHPGNGRMTAGVRRGGRSCGRPFATAVSTSGRMLERAGLERTIDILRVDLSPRFDLRALDFVPAGCCRLRHGSLM